MTPALPVLAAFVLSAASALAQSNAGTPDFVTVLQRNLKSWDKDSNNMLSPLEVDAALADPKLSGEDAAAAATIKCVSRDNVWRIRRIDIPTIKDDLRIVKSRKPDDYFGDDAFTPDWQKAFELAIKRGNAMSEVGQELSLDSLRVDDYGSDAFVAVLGAYLILNPQPATAMVRTLPDGKAQITTPLWTRPFGPITAAQSASCSTTGNGFARSVECGIDSLNRERFPQAAYDGKFASFTDRFAIAQNYLTLIGGKQNTVQTFRGTSGSRNKNGWEFLPHGTPDGLASTASQILTQALAKKRMAIAVTSGSAIVPGNVKGPSSQGPLPPGIRANSFFPVVAVDPKAKTITLWCPSGGNFSPTGTASATNGYAMSSGKFTMPLNEFTYVFAGYVVEGDNAATLSGQSRGRH